MLKLDRAEKIKKSKYDPNIVSLEQSEDETSSESDEEPVIIANTILDVTENEPSIQEDKIKSPTEDGVKSKTDFTNTKSVEGNIENEKTMENNKVTKKKLNKNVAEKSEVKVEVKKPLLSHLTVNVEVKRDPKIQVSRLKLPILGEEQRIMELINENEFLIVAGETGIFLYKNYKKT